MGTLERETTFDEDENRIDVWRDVAGRVVMENREGRKTYYVYDERSFLRYVLQPNYQQEASLSKYAFQYLYDSKGRCIKKTLPGCEYIFYRYDDCNRIAYMQDGAMRDLGKYRFTFYDQMGRLAVQGICTQPRADGASATVTYSNSTAGICSTGWSLPSGASLGTTTLEQANYYDDYSFLSSSAFSGSGLTSLTGGDATGLLTGTLSLTSNSVTLCSVNYYDGKGRLTSSQQTLPYSRKLRTDTQYTFTGKASSVTETVTTGTDTYTLEKYYTYSPYNDQPTQLNVAYGGFMDDVAAGYEYNDLGRLSKITRPDVCDTQYTYNQRGWLTGISDTEFSQWLYYADGGYPAYNGNLGKMEWRYGNGSVKYCYDFQYENNQLTDAYYYLSSGASTNRYGMTADYDNNGNLTTLLRYGRLDNASYGLIDNLTYTYNGNQLLSVSDAVDGPNYTGAFHFIDGNTSGNDYEYDKNGNLKKDKNKNILSIQYNLLNLPTSMSLSNYNTANWTYDAKGTKLRSTFFSMSPYVYYYEDYCGSFVFRNNQLERVQFDEGYITLESSNTQKLHYYLKDHQGNVRLVVENGPDEQMNEYYPYGGLTYNSDLTNTVQPYKYNGKELDRIHGLDTYDYDARQYDPNIGRFTQVDPLAEKYYHLSPYAYCANNPVNLVDLNGEEPGDYFETIDKAAIDFGRFFNYLSITEKKEYSSYIYKTKDSWGNTAYSYTIPNGGGERFASPTEKGLPKNATIVGRVHSHANWDKNIVNNGGDGNEIFSKTDKGLYEKELLYGYVSTPKGKLLKYDPYNQVTTLIDKDMPRDRATVGVNQRYIRTYKHSEGSTQQTRRDEWYNKKYQESYLNQFISLFFPRN